MTQYEQEMAILADRYAEKRAAGLADYVRGNPEAVGALLGAGVGAGAGGLGHLLGNAGKPPEERRGLGRSLLTGALAGGALGGGLGLAGRAYGQLGAAAPPGDLPPGHFPDPRDPQKTLRISPEALRANPELAKKVRELSQGPSQADQVARSAAGAVGGLAANAVPGLRSVANWWTGNGEPSWLEKKLPFSTSVLPKIGLIDALLHAPGLNLGERLGLGRIRPEFSNDPRHLAAGIMSKDVAVADPVRAAVNANVRNQPPRTPPKGQAGPPSPPGAVHALGAGQGGVTDLLARQRLSASAARWRDVPGNLLGRLLGNRGAGSDTLLEVTHRPPEKMIIEDKGHPTQTQKLESTQPGAPKTDRLTRTQAQAASRLGYQAMEAVDNAGKSPRGLFRAGPWQFRMPSLGKQLGARALLYGSVPLGEYVLGGLAKERSDQQQMLELLDRLRPQGHVQTVQGR